MNSLEAQADLEIHRLLLIMLIQAHPDRATLLAILRAQLETAPKPSPPASGDDDPEAQGAQLFLGVARSRLEMLLLQIEAGERRDVKN